MQKVVHLFKSCWAVSPFLASLELKWNTFIENWNFEYYQITYDANNRLLDKRKQI